MILSALDRKANEKSDFTGFSEKNYYTDCAENTGVENAGKVNVLHCRCSLTPTTIDAAGRSQRVVGIGSKS